MLNPDRNAGLDPHRDYLQIYRNLSLLDFPWDFNQSLSFALFRTYAVPSVGRLLDESGGFDDTQKRYELMGEAQKILADDAVNAFLFQLAKAGVWNAKLEGLWENSPIQANDLTEVRWTE